MVDRLIQLFEKLLESPPAVLALLTAMMTIGLGFAVVVPLYSIEKSAIKTVILLEQVLKLSTDTNNRIPYRRLTRELTKHEPNN